MTAPAAVSCEAWVNGARLADTADTYQASTPTALEGLKVTWGRDNSMDQPATSSCTLTVADPGDDTDYLGLLHVGDSLEVYAAGRVRGGGDPYDVAVDGSFETTDPPGRVAATGAGVAADTSHVGTGARNLVAVLTGKTATIVIPPAPFGATSSASEWSTVPTVSAGQRWTLSLTVTLGWWQRVTVSGAVFRNPADRHPRPAGPRLELGPGDTATSTITLDWDVTGADGAGWAGLQLSVTDQAWDATMDTWADQFGSWADWKTLWFDDLVVTAPPTAQRRVLVFTGRITDLDASWAQGTRCAITASDWTADLANDQIGDTPWLAQTIAERVARIETLAAVPFTVDIDPHPAGLQVSWRDVDAAAVLGLLTELAVTADAVLWPAFSATRGFYLWMEDPAGRGALGTLFFDDDTDLVEITATRPATAVSLSACDLAVDGVHWVQDSSDVITRVSVSWQEQTVDGDGNPAPTEARILLEEPDRLATFGPRKLDWSTQLTSESDAFDVANRVLARTDELDWHATGLLWDSKIPVEFTDPVRAVLLDLLDGTRRIGLPLVVVDMPGWTPAGDTLAAYVEGGGYSYTGGRWQLALNVSPSPQLGASVLWTFDLDPAWRWSDFDPAISWTRLWGVSSTTASARWNTLDTHPWSADTNTWTDYIS